MGTPGFHRRLASCFEVSAISQTFIWKDWWSRPTVGSNGELLTDGSSDSPLERSASTATQESLSLFRKGRLRRLWVPLLTTLFGSARPSNSLFLHCFAP